MKRGLFISVLSLVILTANSTTLASLYEIIGSKVRVMQTGYSRIVDETNYSIDEYTVSVTNRSSDILNDVKYVIPFEKAGYLDGDSYHLFDYYWDNANRQWYSDEPSGNDGMGGVYLKYVQADGSAHTNFLLMSDTDIPLEISGGQLGSQSHLSTDSVFTWDVASLLLPGETATFKMYHEIEKDPSISGTVSVPFVVAIPEPSTLSLLTIGLLLLRKKRIKIK